MALTELIFASLLLVFLPLMILRTVLAYKERKRKEASVGLSEANSLTTSELQALIEQSVEQVVQPLVERLELLESEISSPSSTSRPLHLEETDETSNDLFSPAVEPLQAKTVGRPLRSS